jgi:hypothetical protein
MVNFTIKVVVLCYWLDMTRCVVLASRPPGGGRWPRQAPPTAKELRLHGCASCAALRLSGRAPSKCREVSLFMLATAYVLWSSSSTGTHLPRRRSSNSRSFLHRSTAIWRNCLEQTATLHWNSSGTIVYPGILHMIAYGHEWPVFPVWIFRL